MIAELDALRPRRRGRARAGRHQARLRRLRRRHHHVRARRRRRPGRRSPARATSRPPTTRPTRPSAPPRTCCRGPRTGTRPSERVRSPGSARCPWPPPCSGWSRSRSPGVADRPQHHPPAGHRRPGARGVRPGRPHPARRGPLQRRARRSRAGSQRLDRVRGAHRRHCRDLHRRLRGPDPAAVRGVAADRGRRRGDLGPGRRRGGRRRRGVAQRRRPSRPGSEEMGASIREIAHSANEAARVAAAGRLDRGDHERDRRQARHLQPGDRQRGQGDHLDRRADRTCWRSTRPSRRPGPGRPARASRSWPTRSRSSPRRPRGPPRTSRAGSRRSRPTPAARSPRSARSPTIITSINDYQLTIASAVEEQTATTSEMSRNVVEASTGSGEIAQNIAGVAASARHDVHRRRRAPSTPSSGWPGWPTTSARTSAASPADPGAPRTPGSPGVRALPAACTPREAAEPQGGTPAGRRVPTGEGTHQGKV